MPPRAEPVKQKCIACGKIKPVDAFGWAARKHRPTKTCKACWRTPSHTTSDRNESTEELILYYSHVRGMMEELNREHAKAIEDGLPLDHKVESLGDVWVSEMTEEVYRAIVKALIIKAENGDVRATELLLQERHRRAGEPTPQSVEESFEGLFNYDPLAPNMDTA